MKLNKSTLVLAALATFPAAAIERPALLDQETPPSTNSVTPRADFVDQIPQAEKVGDDLEVEQAQPWLGVGGTPLHADLAWHLGIDGGVQLRDVIADSPAALAGLQPGDIVTSFNGVDVHSQAELGDAISRSQPGDEVTVGIVQKGQASEMKVTLGSLKGVHAQRSAWNQARKGRQAQPLPQDRNLLHGDIRQQLEEMHRRLQMDPFDSFGGLGFGDDLDMSLSDLFQQMRNQQDLSLGISSGSITYRDDEGGIEMQSTNGKRHLKVTDKDGKTLFEGPYETEADKQALPENLRERVENSIGLADGTGSRTFRFQFGGALDE